MDQFFKWSREKDVRALREDGTPFLVNGRFVLSEDDLAKLEAAEKERAASISRNASRRAIVAQGWDSMLEADATWNPFGPDSTRPRRPSAPPFIPWSPNAEYWLGRQDGPTEDETRLRKLIESSLPEWVPNPYRRPGSSSDLPTIKPTVSVDTTGDRPKVVPPPPTDPYVDDLFKALAGRAGRGEAEGEAPHAGPPKPAAGPKGTTAGPGGTRYDNETGILYGGFDDKLDKASNALRELDPKELGDRYDKARKAILDKAGVTDQEVSDYYKRNHTPKEAIQQKYRELVADPGGKVYGMVKDDPKLVKQILNTTIGMDVLVAAVADDPIYAARGIAADVLWSAVEGTTPPTLREWWNRNESPEVTAIDNSIDILFERLDTLFDAAKKTNDRAARDQLTKDITAVRQEITRLKGKRDTLKAATADPTTTFEGTPDLYQRILRGETVPERRQDTDVRLPPGPPRPPSQPRPGRSGFTPTPRAARELFQVGAGKDDQTNGPESPQIEALKRSLRTARGRNRERLTESIRRLRRGEAALPAPAAGF